MGTDPSVVPKQQDEGQWPQRGPQEAPAEYEEKCLYFVGDRALQQGAQRGCGVSCPGEIQKPSGHNLVQPGMSQYYFNCVLPVAPCTLTYLSIMVTSSRKIWKTVCMIINKLGLSEKRGYILLKVNNQLNNMVSMCGNKTLWFVFPSKDH